jgi:hypothetical protein
MACEGSTSRVTYFAEGEGRTYLYLMRWPRMNEVMFYVSPVKHFQNLRPCRFLTISHDIGHWLVR